MRLEMAVFGPVTFKRSADLEDLVLRRRVSACRKKKFPSAISDCR